MLNWVFFFFFRRGLRVLQSSQADDTTVPLAFLAATTSRRGMEADTVLWNRAWASLTFNLTKVASVPEVCVGLACTHPQRKGNI